MEDMIEIMLMLQLVPLTLLEAITNVHLIYQYNVGYLSISLLQLLQLLRVSSTENAPVGTITSVILGDITYYVTLNLETFCRSDFHFVCLFVPFLFVCLPFLGGGGGGGVLCVFVCLFVCFGFFVCLFDCGWLVGWLVGIPFPFSFFFCVFCLFFVGRGVV